MATLFRMRMSLTRRLLRFRCHRVFVLPTLLVVILLVNFRSYLMTARDNLDVSIDDMRTQLQEVDNEPQQRLQCQYPKLKPWDQSMLKFFKVHPPLVCDAPRNWIEVVDGRFIVRPESEAEVGKIRCNYKAFERKSDTETVEAADKPIENNTLIPSDFFRVHCVSANGAKYTNMHAGIHYNETTHQRLKKTKPPTGGMGLNIIIIGFDSVSRMQFSRKLPESVKFFQEELKGVVLKGFNILGDGTPQALIPMLTGKTERELPNVLRGTKDSQQVDVLPFVWNNFTNNGYVTAWSEDAPEVGTFTYRMTGFTNQPTDHYMRVFHNQDSSNNLPKHCIGDRPRARVVLDWVSGFMKMYKSYPKFAFMFHNELSHGHNDLLQTGDVDLLDFLNKFKKEKYIDNSILILMADHGARFPEQRLTLQGKQEERNPFFGFAFPPWFRRKYPNAYANLIRNSDKLVTMFDIHETFLDILNYRGSEKGDVANRGISLFKEVPSERTCHHAGVDPHWCNCLSWIDVKNSDTNATSAAYSLVTYINKLTNEVRDRCVKVTLDVILEALKFNPTPEMLKFKQSQDINGLIPDMSDNTAVAYRLYQVKVQTWPNSGLYEATIRQDIQSGQYSFNEDDISRINKYGDDPHCIKQTHTDLRKYCMCTDRV